MAPLNDDVVFDCSLNVPTEMIRWRHGRKYLQQNRTVSPRTSANTQLIIKIEDESQLGDYQVGVRIVGRTCKTSEKSLEVVAPCLVRWTW